MIQPQPSWCLVLGLPSTPHLCQFSLLCTAWVPGMSLTTRSYKHSCSLRRLWSSICWLLRSLTSCRSLFSVLVSRYLGLLALVRQHVQGSCWYPLFKAGDESPVKIDSYLDQSHTAALCRAGLVGIWLKLYKPWLRSEFKPSPVKHFNTNDEKHRCENRPFRDIHAVVQFLHYFCFTVKMISSLHLFKCG